MVRARPDLVDLMVTSGINHGSLRHYLSGEAMTQSGRLFESIWIAQGRVITSQVCIHPLQKVTSGNAFLKVNRMQFAKLCGRRPRGETLNVPLSSIFPEVRTLQRRLAERGDQCGLKVDIRGSEGSFEAHLSLMEGMLGAEREVAREWGRGVSWLAALEDAARKTRIATQY